MIVFAAAMSFLRGSANYVWCTTSVLGKGATGAVFQVRLTYTVAIRFVRMDFAG